MSLEIKPEKGNELFSCPRAQFSTPAYALKYYPVATPLSMSRYQTLVIM